MIRPGNRLTLLENGAQYFPALIAAIDAARHEIHLESYIFSADATGLENQNVWSALARKGLIMFANAPRNCLRKPSFILNLSG